MSRRDSGTPSSSSSENSRLPRGSACINCNRRRVKCDGQRPTCGPCLKYRGQGQLDDCEFCEGQISRTEMLEQQIRELEERIDPRNLQLHQPYLTHRPIIPSVVSHPSHGTSFSSEDIKTLPANKIHGFLSHFNTFAPEVGFFLDIDRFANAAMQPQNAGHHSRPCPSLLYAVCLWGTKPLPNSARRMFEEVFLSSALYFVTEDLSGSHPRKCLQVLQAEVLLSMYFLNNDKMVQGFYHANAAASLAVSTKSNLIRSASTMQRSYGDAVDEGEWIDGFWTTVTLSNYWVLVNEKQTFTFYDAPQMAIDTPWPLDNYRQEKIIPASHKTLEKFLNGSPDSGYSLLALHAKASILLKKAIENSQRSDQGAVHQFNAMNRALEHTASTLPKPDQHMSPQQRQRLAATHILTQAAIIKLHRYRAQASTTSRQMCVRAAQSIAGIASRCPAANPLRLVNPAIGFISCIAHDILKMELLFLDKQGHGKDINLLNAVNQILQRMDSDGDSSPLIGSLVQSINKAG